MIDIIIEYMTAKGYMIDIHPSEKNIVYIEGMNPDFTLNSDAFDAWNDLSLIFEYNAEGIPEIIFSAICTTEPGRAATLSKEARALGGVARIAFGQFTAWRMGFHKRARLLDTHPALVQCAPIPVHRDLNRDGKRTNDPIGIASGLNHHSTNPNYNGGIVGKYSAGCLVRKFWKDHMLFIDLLKTDPRYVNDAMFVFTSTIIAGDDLFKFKKGIYT